MLCTPVDLTLEVGVSTFEPDHLLQAYNPFSWWTTVKDEVVLFGNCCSIIVVFYLSLSCLKCAFNTGRMILNDRLPVPEALRFSVGLTDLIQRRLIAERTRSTAVIR